MSKPQEDYKAAFTAARIAAGKVAIAELLLGSGESSVSDLADMEANFCRAARDLTAAVDALPPEWAPKGWRTT